MDGRRVDDIYWLHQAGGWESRVQVLARRWLRSATAASSWRPINVMYPLDIQPWGVRAKVNVWIRDPQGVLDRLFMIWSHGNAGHFPARVKLSETRLTPGANQCYAGIFTHRWVSLLSPVFFVKLKPLMFSLRWVCFWRYCWGSQNGQETQNWLIISCRRLISFFTRRQLDLYIVDNFADIYLDSLSN